jgi:hypothetical protein
MTYYGGTISSIADLSAPHTELEPLCLMVCLAIAFYVVSSNCRMPWSGTLTQVGRLLSS